MQRVRKLVAETEPDVLKANSAIGFCIASILSVGLAAVLKDWSTWCEPETDVCEETDTSKTQYGAVRAFVVLSVPAALACMYMARKVAKDTTEMGYFRYLWYACSASQTLLGLVAMVLYMVITVSAGDPHTRYGPGFAFAVLSWILALGNFLCASVISPGLRQSCACCSGQTLDRGDDLLTEDERDAYLPSNTPPSSPPNPVRSPRQGSLQVERAPLAGAV